MTAALPEGIGMDDEIGIDYERDHELGQTKVVASLGGATITAIVPDTEAGMNQAALLVQALGGIMEAAYQALEEEA